MHWVIRVSYLCLFLFLIPHLNYFRLYVKRYSDFRERLPSNFTKESIALQWGFKHFFVEKNGLLMPFLISYSTFELLSLVRQKVFRFS